jgi:hypothetical protein
VNVLKNAMLVMVCGMLAACATAQHSPSDDKDTPASASKRSVSEQLLHREKFVLESGPQISTPYTIEFYPKSGHVKMNSPHKNICFPGMFPATFFIHSEFDNVAVRVTGRVTGCEILQYVIDPVTGVSGEYQKQNGGKWSAWAYRFYLKRD